MMDLDERIGKIRQKAMSKTEGIDIDQIYDEILCEASKLNIEGKANRGKKSALGKRGNTVKVDDLLKNEGSEFIKECYKEILRREVNRKELLDNLYLLWTQTITKIELIFLLVNSNEGKIANISLEGGRFRYRFNQILKKCYKIPILGKIIHYFIKVVRVNKTLYQMMNWNLEMESQNDQLKRDCNSLAEKLNKLESYRLNFFDENLRNNNSILAKHEKLLEEYIHKDKIILQKIQVELCNMKANMQYNQDVKNKIEGVDYGQQNISKNSYYSIDYFDFENRFRGSREHVKNTQQIYLPYFSGKNHVVDLGCGRGEFVELLYEKHIGVQGVDIYQPYVEFGKMKHLPIEYSDAIAFLKKQDTVDGIFIGQVVEHLSIEQIIELCRVAYEKLEEDCYLIIETPNPTSLAIYTEAFYVDPSHNKPVHPKMLQYIVEKEGFKDVEIKYTDSSKLPYSIPPISDYMENPLPEFDAAMKRVSDLLYGSQDYAVIAKK